mmetsp:Transcript_22153/g.32171  ORF Transcript_22153/g.32171 Transcript_22153/m.32171 type:complete len:286 (-) Transcript_22153:3-860(-)
MGSLAKWIGQLTARSMESESAKILRTIQSNKIPNSLSQRLDTTLKDSHDMRVFGLGTLSSMSNIERYARFTYSMYGIYSTMEHELDISSGSAHQNSASAAVEYFWNQHGDILRRSEKLKEHLKDIGKDLGSMDYPTATLNYMHAIRLSGASDRKLNGGLLLGHAYTRYLADLMGGQVIGTPTRLALGLQKDSPKQYTFDLIKNGLELTRKEYIEKIYQDLNTSGDIILKGTAGNTMKNREYMQEKVVDEARSAFRHNIEVYSEEPILADSVVGLRNIISGWLLRK